jgi:hypothetical protein
MASTKSPGIVCQFLNYFEIDTGTMCRSAAPTPGPTNSVPNTHKKVTNKAIASITKTYKEHFGAVNDPVSYIGAQLILNKNGSSQCAALVQKLAGAPPTVPDGWQRGTDLTYGSAATLEIGTPIATGWDDRGFYPNNDTGQHSGIFAGAAKDKGGKVVGFTIVEQYVGAGAILSRIVYFDPVAMKKKDTYFYRGKDYSTIKW